jgi:LysR family transcriptional regulator (chromosome initiation inhibitor)
MRYVPVAAPALRRRFTTAAGVDWADMPVLRFNAKDDLQQHALRARGVDRSPPTHTVPSAEGFLAAVRGGLGWGMLPELQLGTDLADGSLDLLEDHAHHDVALYWQSWSLDSGRLHRITECVRRIGRAHLRSTAQDG